MTLGPLEKAGFEANGKQELDMTKAVAAKVPTTGSLNANTVIFINPPRLGENAGKPAVQKGLTDMQTTYKNIFATFQKNHTTNPGDKSVIAIPAFNVGKGGIPPAEGAKVAVIQATSFLRANPDLAVRFVCYTGDAAGKASFAAYQQVINSVTRGGTDTDLAARLKVVEGNIEEAVADSIVCPIFKNFQSKGAGPIAERVCAVAEKQRVTPRETALKSTSDKGAAKEEDMGVAKKPKATKGPTPSGGVTPKEKEPTVPPANPDLFE